MNSLIARSFLLLSFALLLSVAGVSAQTRQPGPNEVTIKIVNMLQLIRDQYELVSTDKDFEVTINVQRGSSDGKPMALSILIRARESGKSSALGQMEFIVNSESEVATIVSNLSRIEIQQSRALDSDGRVVRQKFILERQGRELGSKAGSEETFKFALQESRSGIRGIKLMTCSVSAAQIARLSAKRRGPRT